MVYLVLLRRIYTMMGKSEIPARESYKYYHEIVYGF